VVPPGTNVLEIAYTSFSLMAPFKARFRYRLSGFDDQWQEVGGRRTAYFSRLPPGEYTFEVAASNNDGVWSTEAVGARLLVQPLLWERRDVRVAGLGVLLLATGLAVSTWSQRRARRRLEDLVRAQALERERTRIARDLHDDLGARLSHIALMAEPTGPAPSPLRLAGAARDAVEVLDELVWVINARNDTAEGLATYGSRFAEEHVTAAGLRYRAHLAGDLELYELASGARRHLYLALKEAVNNAVKHAGATEIQLHISAESHQLCLCITDNGRGIPGDGGDPTGNGLTSIRERLAAVHGTVRFDPFPGGGTRVVFTVPVTPKTTRARGTY
jgi:signal transduction histidine kinase